MTLAKNVDVYSICVLGFEHQSSFNPSNEHPHCAISDSITIKMFDIYSLICEIPINVKMTGLFEEYIILIMQSKPIQSVNTNNSQIASNDKHDLYIITVIMKVILSKIYTYVEVTFDNNSLYLPAHYPYH